MLAPAGNPVAVNTTGVAAHAVMVAFGVTVSVAVSPIVWSGIGAIVTGALSTVPVAGPPFLTNRSLFPQSRIETESITTENGPLLTFLSEALNRLPLEDVTPHGAPSATASTVYEPPPLSTFWNVVV